MNTGKMLISIFSGLIAGAVIGVLFAPYKGSETRRRLLTNSDEYSDLAKDRFNEYVEIINGKLEIVKNEISEYSDLVRGKIREYKKTKSATMN